MNDPRVDAFWMEAGDMGKHKAFIESNMKDKHTLGVIGSYTTMKDGFEGKAEVEDAVYAEIYWGKVRLFSRPWSGYDASNVGDLA